MDRNTKTRRNKQMQVQHTSSSLACDGCIGSPSGGKVAGCEANKDRQGTAVECSRVEYGRVTFHLKSCSHEQVLRWGQFEANTREKPWRTTAYFSKKDTVTTDLSLELSDRNWSKQRKPSKQESVS